MDYNKNHWIAPTDETRRSKNLYTLPDEPDQTHMTQHGAQHPAANVINVSGEF